MILKFDLYMDVFHDMRTVHMYLPDDYLESMQRYPVLYMFDGHNLFYDEDATYGTSWRLGEHIVDLGYKMIVVGLECSHNGNQRLDEYGPYPFADMDYIASFDGHGGDATMDFFIHTLKPYIDAHFPTLPQRETTWIGGSSCGGLMALYAHLNFSDVYSKSLVISPFVTPTEDYCYINAYTSNINENNSIYMSWGALEGSGKHEFSRVTTICTKIKAYLEDKGVTIQTNVKLDGRHCEEDWAKECPTFLKFLFK